jgi:hypothetical protein
MDKVRNPSNSKLSMSAACVVLFITPPPFRMEAICSSETSDFVQTTRRCKSEHYVYSSGEHEISQKLYYIRRENLKFQKLYVYSSGEHEISQKLYVYSSGEHEISQKLYYIRQENMKSHKNCIILVGRTWNLTKIVLYSSGEHKISQKYSLHRQKNFF